MVAIDLCDTTKVALPLAVDLDGTLILSDTLHESLIALVKTRPLALPALWPALRRGRAALKRRVAESVTLDAATLPYDSALLDYLRNERRAGRSLGLFTAADQSIADGIATELGLFDVAVGSDGEHNLAGVAKAHAIEQAFGSRFVYAGNGAPDQPIFARAQGAILVGSVARLQANLARDIPVEAEFPRATAGPAVWARALRLQHWAKNALVFVAPVFAPFVLFSFIQAAMLFVLLGVLASATYLINDLLDLSSDRRHPVKHVRPFAAGIIPLRDGVFMAAALIVMALMASLALPRGCSLALLAYLGITLAYSLWLKPYPMVDVTALAGLFTLRVLAGSLLVPTPISPWLLTFSMLFFLGLAVIKRYAELDRMAREHGDGVTARGYTREDLPILLTTGITAGISAIVIFMIYLINDQYPRTIYHRPQMLWAIMPVLLVWTLRLWHRAVHGRMSEDPVVYALQDRISWLLGAVIALILVLARL